MGVVHYFGSLCLFTATILLVLASAGVPVWKRMDFYYSSSADLSLGPWGICFDGGCTTAKLGYDLSSIVNLGFDSSSAKAAIESGVDAAANAAIKSLTYAFVLNPLAAGLTGVAVLLSTGTCFALGIVASLFAFLASLITTAAFAVDLAFAVLAKNRLEDDAHIAGEIGKAVWLVLVAAALQLLASFTVCCTRHSSYSQKRGAV